MGEEQSGQESPRNLDMQASTPAEGIFMVPFPRDPNYVAREDIHDQLGKLLVPNNDAQPRAALWGLGGVGKTAIVVDYCYRCLGERERSTTSIFWVHGSSNETFKASYRDIAKRIEIKAIDDDKSAFQEAVKDWLESPASGEWIIIIDNLDEIDTKYIPTRKGLILFTTRDLRIVDDSQFAVPENAVIKVPIMSFSEASAMYQTLGITDDSPADPIQRSTRFELLGRLDYLPLAIAQSAVYIRNNGGSMREYTELFKESAAKQMALLDEPLVSFSGDDANARTMRTWDSTADKIKAEEPLAIEILQFMSFMSPKKISLGIIRAAPCFKTVENSIFSKSIHLLFCFGFLASLGSSHYRMHRLVSFWSRMSMEKAKRKYLLHAAAESLKRLFPKDTMENLSTCSRLLPHAVRVLDHMREDDTEMNLDDSMSLHASVADTFSSMGDYSMALEWYSRDLVIREMALGRDHLSTLYTVHNMAVLFDNLGKYDTALKWHRRALEGREKALGKDDPETLTTVHNMAAVFHKQGQHDKALEWYSRVLEGKEKALGKDRHTDTLATINNMALIFNIQGQHEKALEWYRRALEGLEKLVGKDHPETLGVIHNIAMAYQTQERYDEALELYKQAFEGREKTLGIAHPDTLATAQNMAKLFRQLGQYGKALEWYGRILEGKETNLGEYHPETLGVVYNMAVVFEKQGQYDKALEFHRWALEGNERMLGTDHPDTLDTVQDIAMVFCKQRKYDKALQWCRRALDGMETVFGKDHPRTLSTLQNISLVFRHLEQYENALDGYRRVLDCFEKMFGKDHPSTLDTVNNMAVVFDIQGEYDKALEWYRRALEGYEKALGKVHPVTMNTVYNMAIMFRREGNNDEAVQWYNRALEGYEKTLGKDHPNTLRAADGMASVLRIIRNSSPEPGVPITPVITQVATPAKK